MKRKICIYCAGVHGLRMYFRLKSCGIKVDFFGDREEKCQGYVVDDVFCKSYEEVLKEDKDTIIIVANVKSEKIVEGFRRLGFRHVWDEKNVLKRLSRRTHYIDNNLIDIEFLRREKERIRDLYPFAANLNYNFAKGASCSDEVKILQVNFTDLPGRVFNGYDLMDSLNRMRGFSVKQFVREKKSKTDTVLELAHNLALKECAIVLEEGYGVDNLLNSNGIQLYNLLEFQKADIVHFHILHNNFISLFDYPLLMNAKPSVWTIHDPWILTGGCIYPLNCNGWIYGCNECHINWNKSQISYRQSLMWKIKQEILNRIHPDIVVSCSFMKNLLLKSPLSSGFRNIHEIPFGIPKDRFDPKRNYYRKKELGIPKEKLVIGFRATNDPVKGCVYLYDALRKLNKNNKIILLSIGGGEIPHDITERYVVISMGWVNDEERVKCFMEAVDIFVMPSLAESFGVMSIEAMAAGCAVLCFKGTTIEELSVSPTCGMAVDYQSSDALSKMLQRWIDNPKEVEKRGHMAEMIAKHRYSFDDYVRRHEMLYNELLRIG